MCIVALILVLAPAWSSMDTYDGHNAANIGLQAESDLQQEPQIDQLLAYVRAHPKGRVYAGAPTNWGQDFLVGDVPVFKYLESKDIDEVGYTLRTASLMTDPEFYFDESNPGDYPLFGIGYLITPADMAAPVEATKVGCSGDYCLWALPDAGYIHVYDTTGKLTATRADVGTQSEALLGSPLLNEERDLTVAFNGQAAADPTAPDASTLQGTPGHVVVEHADLPNGRAGAVVHTTRRATVVLSASYDPGWEATVNGRPAPTVMVAPALVGVVVGPGVHTVTFSYAGYGSYTALFVLAFVVLAGLALAPLRWRRLRRSTGAHARGQWGAMTTLPSREQAPTTDPADVVVRFLRDLAAFDVDAALDLVSEDLVYTNVSLPTLLRARPAGAHRPPLASTRTDGLQRPPQPRGDRGERRAHGPDRRAQLRPLRRAFWVYGRFVVRDDGKIAVWRDSFDWLDVTIANLRGLAGLVSPGLNRRMPTD